MPLLGWKSAAREGEDLGRCWLGGWMGWYCGSVGNGEGGGCTVQPMAWITMGSVGTKRGWIGRSDMTLPQRDAEAALEGVLPNCP